MTKGRIIAVVGPSGVGKDSLIRGITEASPYIKRVRRTITRAPGLGGEEYDAVSPMSFARQVSEGAFCLRWQAHGLWYGIPVDVLADVENGTTVIANLSRSVLAEANQIFPDMTVLNITASPATLAARLAQRGRETQTDITQRLRRAVNLPEGLKQIDIPNDGALSKTIAAALTALNLNAEYAP